MDQKFEQALSFIEERDAESLEKFLQANPELINQVDEEVNLLHHAAASGSLPILEVLLENGALPDGIPGCAATPLHWAASLDLKDVCRELVDFGASLETTDSLGEGGTALVQALFYGHCETADYLAEKLISPENLRVAAGLGNVEMMEQFFDGDSNLTEAAGMHREWYRANEEFPERPTTDSAQEILDEALCYACFNNRFDAARFLLERGADPNAKPFYATALHFAVAKDNMELVDMLLEAGADPLLEDDNYKSTAQGWAEWGCQEEMAGHLLELMEDQDLVYAVASGKVEKVQKFIDSSRKRDLVGEKGKQALLEALDSGDKEIEKLLRDNGAKLCLGSAAAIGSLEDVEFLVGQGLSPNSTMTVSVAEPGSHAKDKEISALLLAAVNRHKDVCHKLIDAGAKLDIYSAAALNMVSEVESFLKDLPEVDAEDEFGRTALHRGIQGDALDVVRLLLDKGADLDKSADFFTFGPRAIHVAAEAGVSTKMIDLLVSYGADINSSCNQGTPVECAFREGRDELVDYLKSLGADVDSLE